MQIVRYDPSHKEPWDAVVRTSKNGTFLFLRDYLEYHRSRFDDHSLLVFDERKLLALLPGHQAGSEFISHGGITHGGFVVDEGLKLPTMLALFDAVAAHLRDAGFRRWIYKTVPYIYHRVPSEEDRYALYLLDAHVIRRGALTVLGSRSRPEPQARRARGAKQARRLGVDVRESRDFGQFWGILAERLLEAYGTSPVHSLAEITALHGLFPANIRLLAAFHRDAMTAGVVIYESTQVARFQYIAANQWARDSGALDLLILTVINDTFAEKPYIDLGTSDERDGRSLNQGLVEQKEGFGGRIVAHDHYSIDLSRAGRCVDALSIRK